MKSIFWTLCISGCLLILTSCSNPINEKILTQSMGDNTQPESSTCKVPSESPTTPESVTIQPSTSKESLSDLDEKAPPMVLGDPDINLLEEFTKDEIEYASIWLQLGPNQEIDELNVQHIRTGTPLNEEDITSAVYEEDVTMLSGSRLVDGVVTYSKNEDGTINVYPIPLRWDGVYPASYEFYLGLLENKKIVTLEKVEELDLIKLLPLIKFSENN